MDLGAFLAQLAVALAPYAAKGAGKAAEKLAEDVYAKAKGALSALRARVRGKPAVEQALTQYEEAPDNPRTQAALAQALQPEVETQAEFQQELLALAQTLATAVQAANQSGAKYQVVANQIIGQGDDNTFNFYAAPPSPPKSD